MKKSEWIFDVYATAGYLIAGDLDRMLVDIYNIAIVQLPPLGIGDTKEGFQKPEEIYVYQNEMRLYKDRVARYLKK